MRFTLKEIYQATLFELYKYSNRNHFLEHQFEILIFCNKVTEYLFDKHKIKNAVFYRRGLFNVIVNFLEEEEYITNTNGILIRKLLLNPEKFTAYIESIKQPESNICC